MSGYANAVGLTSFDGSVFLSFNLGFQLSLSRDAQHSLICLFMVKGVNMWSKLCTAFSCPFKFLLSHFAF